MEYQAGEKAAINGELRAAPTSLKIVSKEWKDWYSGFDAATAQGKNSALTARFSQRKASKQYQAVR